MNGVQPNNLWALNNDRNASAKPFAARFWTPPRELFLAEGYQNVSIRKIAERIEYNPAALYSYFPSKDDIFFAIAEEGFRALAETVKSGRPIRSTAFARGSGSTTSSAGRIPSKLALMFVDRSVPRISEDWERFGFVQDMMRRAADGIRACMDAGYFPKTLDADAAFHVLWAAVHGPATIQLCNRLGPGEEPDALARDTLETAIAGLRAQYADHIPRGRMRPRVSCR